MATTTILLGDLEAGTIPFICVKTGKPAEVKARFVFGTPSRASSWLSGSCGCAVLIILSLPASIVWAPVAALVAWYVRWGSGVIYLPMTRAARWRLWLGRWIPWPFLICIPVIIGYWGTSSSTPQALYGFFNALAVLWLIAAAWVVWFLATYIQSAGGVPFVGVRGLRKRDPILGPYLELSGVSAPFAAAVLHQYHPDT